MIFAIVVEPDFTSHFSWHVYVASRLVKLQAYETCPSALSLKVKGRMAIPLRSLEFKAPSCTATVMGKTCRLPPGNLFVSP